jgi:hypothetical protein
MHYNILALIYYLSGYGACMFMFVQEEMYIRALGLFLGSYITFNLVTQFDNKEEDGDNPTR